MNNENPTIILAICALLGLVLRNLFEFIKLRRKGNVIDYKYKFKDYISASWDMMIAQFLCVALLFLVVSNIVTYKPVLQNYLRGLFALGGGLGADIVGAFFNNAEKNIIDKIKNFNPSSNNEDTKNKSL